MKAASWLCSFPPQEFANVSHGTSTLTASLCSGEISSTPGQHTLHPKVSLSGPRGEAGRLTSVPVAGAL